MADNRNQLSVRAATIVHLGMVLSSVLIVGVFWFLRGRIPVVLPPSSRRLLSYIAYALAAAVLLITSVLKGSVGTMDREGDSQAWWAAARVRFLGIWMVGDAACAVGAVLWFLTDNRVVLLTLAGAGLLVLAAYRPSKLFDTR